MWLSPNEVCIGVAVSVKISVHVLLQYQSKSYYIIGQEVYYSIGRFYYIIGQLLQYRAFLLHYRAVITVSGVYYIIGWYNGPLREWILSNIQSTLFLHQREVLPSSYLTCLNFEWKKWDSWLCQEAAVVWNSASLCRCANRLQLDSYNINTIWQCCPGLMLSFNAVWNWNHFWQLLLHEILKLW